MPRNAKSLLSDLSTSDLKRLLAARERIDVLEKERKTLTAQLARVDKELAKLVADAGAKAPVRRSAKKAVRKKAARKTTKKTVVRKAAAKKTTRKKVVRKAPAKRTRKTTKKAAAKGAGRVRLEDVIVAVLGKAGGTMAFKDLKDTIVKGKLFATKSKNFDNVLRRTLSTSKAVKRAGRGVYKVA